MSKGKPFIVSFIQENLDLAEKTKAKTLVVVLLICVFLSCFLLVLSYFIPNNFPFLLFIGAGLGMLLLFKLTHSTFWIGNVLAGVVFIIMVTMSRETGGLYSIDLMGILLVPILALTINGFKSSLFWVFMSLIVIIYTYASMMDMESQALYRLQIKDFTAEYYLVFHLVLLLLPLSLVMVLVKLNRSLITNLFEVNENLDESKKILESKSEDLAVAKQELEKSNSLLERYAYSASHDLKQPIRSIISFTELFKMKFDTYKIKDDKLNDYMDTIIESTHRMNNQIEEFLDFSTSEQNEIVEWVELDHVLKNVLIDIKKLLNDENAEIFTHALPKLKVHKSNLAQLFQNLISNAVKYQSPKRPLKIEVNCKEENESWIFSVIDNGIGINPEQHKLIFKNLAQVDNESEGNGIGLSTCQQIIKKYKGMIWVESEYDKGACFYFSLPKSEVS